MIEWLEQYLAELDRYQARMDRFYLRAFGVVVGVWAITVAVVLAMEVL